jgi:hypothetical protein
MQSIPAAPQGNSQAALRGRRTISGYTEANSSWLPLAQGRLMDVSQFKRRTL